MELNLVLTCKRRSVPADSVDCVQANNKTGRIWNSEELVKVVNLTESRKVRLFCLFLISLELMVWIFVLVVGTKYLLVQDNVSNLVQSCVAIVFLNDLDNLAYIVLMPETTKTLISSREYELPHIPGSEGVSEASCMQKFFVATSIFGTSPILTLTAVGMVFGLHKTYC